MSTAFHAPHFAPATGLSSPHAQTIGASLLRPRQVPPLIRERWNTPDGDFVDVDILKADPGWPHLFVLHGLEGSSRAGYVAAIFREARLRQFGVFALNFRSCSGQPNLLARSYHSGETGDALFAIGQIRQFIRGPLFGVGFSLGANVLLRLLEETGTSCPLAGAVAVSAPFDLSRCADALDGPDPWAYLYRNVFLTSLKRKALAKARAHPGSLDPARIRAARGIRDFDDAVTAPLHGFASAEAYYAQSSSGPGLAKIERPTLLLQAKDDPFIPESVFPRALVRNQPWLTSAMTDHGGHVGFIEGSLRQRRYWAEKVAVDFAAHVLECS